MLKRFSGLRLRSLLRRSEGQNLIEYGLVCALISIAAVLVLQAFAPIILGFWNLVLEALQQV